MPEETILPERRLVIARQIHRGQFFTESLSDTVSLDLMLIPGSSFQMGQTEEEKADLICLYGEEYYQQYCTDELPQHSVTVPTFFMGKYPITQAQWRAVAAYPRVGQKLDPDPSNFKSDDHPVEQVSWDDAREFCQRLSQHTGRTYCLPSEAEWEYACRAGTTTPFHFGETLSDELANYRAQDREYERKTYPGIYGRGIYGEYREETIEFGQFPPNAFGLYDMHGNVWEWCEDDYHNSYDGAPSDGSAWIDVDRTETDRILRGGSWNLIPGICRSAVRNGVTRGGRGNHIGFRVCCVPPRILL